jgi:hypothetical protein
MASSMIKQALTYFFVLGIATSSVNPAIAAQKKKSSGIIKKAVAAYVVYRVVKHYKDKEEEQQKAKAVKDGYIEPYYDEDCLDEDECEEE